LVFTRTKHGADRVVKDLDKAGIKAAAIHGNKSQNARQAALSDFKSGKIKVLLATDIASRGIDIDALSHVINFELPNVPETYVHRIGRTGRAGFDGIAFSFCDEEEFGELKDIQKLIGKQIPVNETHPFVLDTRYVESVPSSVRTKPKKQLPPHNKPSRRKPVHKKKV
jgi:ATP-dependent RNA helicase RhlE